MINFFFQQKTEILAVDITKDAFAFTALEVGPRIMQVKGFDAQNADSIFFKNALFNPTALYEKISSFIKDHKMSKPILAISLCDYACFESLEINHAQELEKTLNYACFSCSLIAEADSVIYYAGIAQSLLMQLHCMASRAQLDLVAVTTRTMAYYTLLMRINPSWKACFGENNKALPEYFYEHAHEAVMVNKFFENFFENIDKTKKLDQQLLLSALGLYYLGKAYEAP